jgi:hypothetical protein
MRVIATMCCLLLSASAFGQGYTPKKGFVPDSSTAIKIAEAVLIPVYGEKQIESERPFIAHLNGDTWTVYGTLWCPDGKGGKTEGTCFGGVAMVHVSRLDARISDMGHGK